ncbi:Hsp20/alpha crystallin family protein [Solimonas aquatica]|uniref:Hsp20/alpha crystallin family protein n=1 Tax=Solimonas aquatica TaxID=489703 RepID=A0A1H8ZNF2_9GAMM|nr:Hsp20/alpha crystallin family protein [Solimonas aquatica]
MAFTLPAALLPEIAPGKARYRRNRQADTVKAELAGVAKDAVKVDVQIGVLTLSGERKFEKDGQDQKHHRIERAYGGFTRSFTVPGDVEIAQISAEFEDGVLTVALPKAAVKKPSAQRIEVRGG